MTIKISNLSNPYKSIPEELKSQKSWLLCHKKAPIYLNGRPRSGKQGSNEDIEALADFEDAYDAYEDMRFDCDGIGLALLGHEHIACIDFDHILDDKGELLASHAGYELALACLNNDTVFVEVSASGRGLHAWCKLKGSYRHRKNGVEIYQTNQFIKVTGNRHPQGKFEPLMGLGFMDDAVSSFVASAHTAQSSRSTPARLDLDEDASIPPPVPWTRLKSALEALDGNEREEWIAVGMALKATVRDGANEQRAFQLWHAWSQKSHKYVSEADCRKSWEGFAPTSTGYAAIFKRARDAGWEEHHANLADDAQEDETESSFIFSQFERSDKRHVSEFVLDGFVPCGLVNMSGVSGVGKSTALAALAVAICHCCPDEWQIKPKIRRHVVLVAEEPNQFDDAIKALEAKFQLDRSEVNKWLHIHNVARLQEKGLVKALKQLRSAYQYVDQFGITVEPLIILDTLTSIFGLENENANSEIASYLSSISNSLAGVGIWLIGHTTKTDRNASPEEITNRGGFAYRDLCSATYAFAMENGHCVMAATKLKFPPKYKIIGFNYNTIGLWSIDPRCEEPVIEQVGFSVPTILSEEQRQQQQQVVRTEAQERQVEQALQRLREAHAAGIETSKSEFTRSLPRLEGFEPYVGKGIRRDRLIEAGVIAVVASSREGGGRRPEVVIPL